MAAEERNGEVFTDEECTDCTERERSFDALARGLANGSISRRKALRMLGAALVGSALASIPGMALAKPPPGACKPQGAKCIVNRDCCSQNCFTQKGKLICGPVSGACFNNNDCTSLPGQDRCTRAVCNPAGVCVLEPIANCCLTVSQCPTPNDQCLKATCVNNVCGVEPDAGKSCNDGLRCTEDDRCNAAGLCVGTTKTCPPSNNPCVARTECDSTTGNCIDVPAAVGTPCRDAQGECDLPAVCTGTSTACPDNQFEPSTTVCRPSAGPCDVAETCTGTSAECPTDQFEPATKVCRPSAGPCDVADTCTGASAACPPDQLEASGVACGPTPTQCETRATCTGLTATCPPNPITVGGSCNDNDPCTVNDQCAPTGTCAGTPRICPTGQICVSGTCQCPAGRCGTGCLGTTCGTATTPTCCIGSQICCAPGTKQAGTCKNNAKACN